MGGFDAGKSVGLLVKRERGLISEIESRVSLFAPSVPTEVEGSGIAAR